MSQSGSFSSGGIPKNPTFAVLTVTSRLDLNSGATFNLYNTADKTNYERLRADWSTNVARIFTQYGGSATARVLQIGVAGAAGGSPSAYVNIQTNGLPLFNFVGFNTAGTSTSGLIALTGGSLASSSGTQYGTVVNPPINQSGTAGYTAFDINPTQTATGSGTKLLQRWAVGGLAQAQVNNSGTFWGDNFVASSQLGLSTGIGASIDVSLNRDAADILALRRSTNAQTDRNYETYTDASNYSRQYRGWSGGFAYIGTQAAGTGTRRPLIVQHFATTVAALPAAATAGAGSRCFVSDALGPVFGAAVVGGGAVNVPVYSDGANWLVG